MVDLVFAGRDFFRNVTSANNEGCLYLKHMASEEKGLKVNKIDAIFDQIAWGVQKP